MSPACGVVRGEVSSFVSGEKKAHKQASRSEEPVLNWLVWIFFPPVSNAHSLANKMMPSMMKQSPLIHRNREGKSLVH